MLRAVSWKLAGLLLLLSSFFGSSLFFRLRGILWTGFSPRSSLWMSLPSARGAFSGRALLLDAAHSPDAKQSRCEARLPDVERFAVGACFQVLAALSAGRGVFSGRGAVAFSGVLGGRGTSLRAAGVLVAGVPGRGTLFSGRAAGVLAGG